MTDNIVDEVNEGLRVRSGEVHFNDCLVGFLYDLLKEYPPGRIEKLVRDNTPSRLVRYSNGWLALYARDLAKRLKEEL